MHAPIRTILLSADQSLVGFIRDQLASASQFTWAGTLDPTAQDMLIPGTENISIMIADLRAAPEKVFDLLDLEEFSLRPTVFIHDSDHYYQRSYKYFVIDYLLTPLQRKPLQRALGKAHQLLGALTASTTTTSYEGFPSQIPIKTAGKIQLVPIKEILFIEASGYYIEINTKTKKHLLRESMSIFMSKLPPQQYARIHRSTIIRLDEILEINRTPNRDLVVVMKAGSSFKISSSYKKDFFKKLHI